MTSATEITAAPAVLAALLRAATEQSIIVTDADECIAVFSRGSERLLGWSAEEVVGTSPLRFFDAAEVAARAAESGTAPGTDAVLVGLAGAESTSREWTWRCRDGTTRKVLLSLSQVVGPGGRVDGVLGVATDLTARVEVERRLRASEEQYRLAFETAPSGMAVVSLARTDLGRLLEVNAAFSAFTGRTAAQLLTGRMADLLHPDEVPAHETYLRMAAGQGLAEPSGVHRRFLTPSGQARWGRKSTSVIRPGDGREPHLLVVVEDVTEALAAQSALQWAASHDPLTGLANRSALADELELAAARRGGVVVLDLDGFKAVNDEHGHAAGDALLQEVAVRLAACVREEDTAVRLGGDEFAITCPGLRDDDLPVLVDRLVAALHLPFRLPSGAQVRVGASFGTAVTAPGEGAHQLLQRADQAMYAHKRSKGHPR